MTWSAISTRVSTTVFIMSFLTIGCFFEVSCQTTLIRSYTTKDAETIPCTISDETLAVSWNDVDNAIAVLTYQKGNPPVIIISTEEKFRNFNYTLTPTSLNLVIENVEDGDGGVYSCSAFGFNPVVFDVTVEVLPDEISLDCFVPPAVTCPAQGVTPTSELICTCAATGVRPKSLSLDISGADNVQQDSPVAKDGLFDLSLKATVPVTDSTTEVTCSVNGYNTTEPIPPNLITKALVISPPACALEISFDQDCKEVTLSCSCSAIPTDGETPSISGMVFSYFNGTGHLIAGDATSIVQSNDVEAGVDLTYSCRGCNGLYYGDSSYDTESKVCTINTPVCNMTIESGEDCREVSLTCECDAVPADITHYSFFNGSSNINDVPSKTFTVSAAYETSTGFSCSATNDIGSGEKSDVKVHDCDKATIVTTEQQPTTDSTDSQSLASTTTKETLSTNDNMFKDCNNTGLIAACIVEAIIIVVLILVIIYLIAHDRLGHGKKREPRSTNQIDEIKGDGNRAYMDLQELEVNKNKMNKNLEVPEKNVKLVSLLPGKGMMQYHKALVMRAAGNLEVVIRTLSGDSTLRMNELQSSEVQHILKLPCDNSIVKLFGWCATVPNYLIREYLSGVTLSDHLTEEFSPHKVHQYGNTKQKRFQVAEKGNADHLPKYALQVARGLKFLTTHRFVSPGLRSKKVLLTASGKCKLYDFVSVENAKEWTELIWNENVPFQWMPPEFLLLETISAAGDVWSFGVLLWEIFSYGSEPYRGQTRADVEKSLRAKRQLLIPDNCPGAIWQVMITCWETVAEKRPKIDDVAFKLAAMCNEDKEYQEIE